jgi:hypothetical protein
VPPLANGEFRYSPLCFAFLVVFTLWLWPSSARAQCSHTSAAGASTSSAENADGSFTLDVEGDVEVEFLYSAAAASSFLQIEPTSGSQTCTIGSDSVSQCYVSTDTCSSCASCNLPSDCLCTCRFNTVQQLGHLTAGTVLTSKLFVDVGRDGTLDETWSSDPSQNGDDDGNGVPDDHLQTFKLGDGVWVLEWEDKPFSISDFDFNDLVAMVRVKPTNGVPPSAVSLTTCSVQPGTPTPPDLSYLTNLVVEDLGVPNRKVRLSVLLLNPTNSPQTVATCNMLDFETGLDENMAGYTFNAGDGIPDCTTVGIRADAPSVRFSRDQQFGQSCNLPAPVEGDQVTVPAAVGNVPGETAIEYEFPIDAIDPFIANASNKLGNLTAAQIRDLVNNPNGEGLYTDFLYNIQVPKIDCPSGPLTFFNGNPDPSVANGRFTWNHPTSIAVNSPVALSLSTVNGTTMDPAAPPIQAMFEYLWTDNLPVHLVGHILPSIPPRTPFAAGGSGIRSVPTTLQFPDDLPEGFQGKLDAVLIDVATGNEVVSVTNLFAKDHTAPTVSQVHTVRTASGLTVTAVAADPPTGIGQVRVDVNDSGNALRPDYMHRTSGDFHADTGFQSSFGGVSPSGVVASTLTASDGHSNTTPALVLPVANTGGDRSVECSSAAGATVTLDASGSTGPAGVSVVWSGGFGSATGASVTEALPFGPNPITLTLTAPNGFSGTETSTLTVVDTTPPTITLSSSTPFDLCGSGSQPFVVTPPTVSDLCSSASPPTGSVIASTNPGLALPLALAANGAVSLPIGSHTIRWTSHDAAGNVATKDQVVSVRPAFYAAGTFDVRDHAQLRSGTGFSALGNAGGVFTRLGVGAHSGDIYSTASVDLRDGSTVSGVVRSAGAVTVGNGVTVTGGAQGNTTVSLPPAPALNVTFPTTNNGDVTVNSLQTRALSPAAYASVTVNGGTLRLQAGTYLINSLTVNSGSTVSLPASGSVQLFVRDQLILRGTFSGSAPLVLGFAGNSATTLETPLRARVIAPNAAVTVQQPLTGSLSAHDITVNPSLSLQCALVGAAPALTAASAEVSLPTTLWPSEMLGPNPALAPALALAPAAAATPILLGPATTPVVPLSGPAPNAEPANAPAEHNAAPVDTEGGIACSLTRLGVARGHASSAAWLLVGLVLLRRRQRHAQGLRAQRAPPL